ncbi:hypothetical protein [Antarcticirhabdus aurantiaca]|uniref:Uncharacterized protein n=1 Tax=Antarcticirhabdus aurantiaca TaxID=2606717 RepID=A0ACD4NK05_9HYPH|nr:hypothetical protein [Antarcticirhabdus aurantiaca]WAJ27159.1 hypothetical protein OXU80_20215 [Jeongeuplla avenae]
MAYAETTSVSVEKSEAEIKAMLRKAGATSLMSAEEPGNAVVAFEMQGRRILFRLPLPARDDKRFANDGRQRLRPADKRAAAWEQACRSRWRGLMLCIKAKLESVESGIETFETAFLAHVMLPDGSTVGDYAKPAIALAYETETMPPLLPAPRRQTEEAKER